jgi:hypothetical protein
MNADGHVRGAHLARAQNRRRLARQLADCLGHERRAAFVASRDEPDPGLRQGFEQAEEAFARDGERVASAGFGQRGCDQLGDGQR